MRSPSRDDIAVFRKTFFPHLLLIKEEDGKLAAAAAAVPQAAHTFTDVLKCETVTGGKVKWTLLQIFVTYFLVKVVSGKANPDFCYYRGCSTELGNGDSDV